MSVSGLIRSVLHFLLKVVLLPVKIVLTILIFMFDFAGSVFSVIFGLVGGLIILAGLICLFTPPIDWKLFIEAMIVGTVIGSLPRMVRNFGKSVLNGLIGLLAKI